MNVVKLGVLGSSKSGAHGLRPLPPHRTGTRRCPGPNSHPGGQACVCVPEVTVPVTFIQTSGKDGVSTGGRGRGTVSGCGHTAWFAQLRTDVKAWALKKRSDLCFYKTSEGDCDGQRR